MDHQRNWPAGRALLDLGCLSARQVARQEPSDVALRETEVLHTDNDRAPIDDLRGQVESRIDAECHRNVEIAWRALQQQVDQLNRAARQPIYLVQHDQAGCLVQLDRPRQDPHLLHRRRRRPGVMRVERKIQARDLERAGEVTPNTFGVSSSSSEIQPTTRPCSFASRATSARTVVLPKPAGACNTVRRRSSSPPRRCSNDARRTYPVGNSGAVTFARNSQTGTTLDVPPSAPLIPRPPH